MPNFRRGHRGLAAHGAQNLLALSDPDLGKTPMKLPTDRP